MPHVVTTSPLYHSCSTCIVYDSTPPTRHTPQFLFFLFNLSTATNEARKPQQTCLVILFPFQWLSCPNTPPPRVYCCHRKRAFLLISVMGDIQNLSSFGKPWLCLSCCPHFCARSLLFKLFVVLVRRNPVNKDVVSAVSCCVVVGEAALSTRIY